MRNYVTLAAGMFLLACAPADSEPSGGGAATSMEVPSRADAPAKTLGTYEFEATELETPTQSYTIDLEPAHSVSYRLYADGATITGERGVQGVHDVMGATPIASLTPVQVFQKYKPGLPVPAELLEIQAAMDEAQEFDELGATALDAFTPIEAASSSPLSASTSQVAKAITSNRATFDQAFGCFFGSGDVFDACVTNFAGNAFAQASSRWAIYKLGPYLGQLRFETKVNGTPRLALTIGEGGFWVQSASGTMRNRGCSQSYPDVANHRIDIASSGEHHFSARFHNYRVPTWQCAEILSSDPFVQCTGTFVCSGSHYGF